MQRGLGSDSSNSTLAMPTELHMLFQQKGWQTSGSKMEHCSSVCLDFPSWCKSFANVPLHVSPSTHLIFLTLYALTMLNFCRSSGRVCAWNLPEYKQQNSDKHKCFFYSSSQLFLHFMHSFSCFYYKNLYNISFSYCF